jgi:diguanylate cyclase (GGDEF)-like protein/PAS domain S-box-containing protein
MTRDTGHRGRSTSRRKSASPKRARSPRPEEDGSLRDEVLRLRELFNAYGDGIVFADGATGRVLEVNRTFLDMSGHDAASLIGKALWELEPLRDTDAALVVVRELQHRSRIFYDDLPFLRKDGTRTSIELTCTALRTAGKLNIQCSFRDIEARKTIEEVLWRSESRFRALFQQAHVGIAFVDHSGRVIDNNGALETMLGCGANELRGMHYASFMQDSDRAAEAVFFQELLDGRRTSYHLTLRHRRKNGDELWGLVGVTAVAGSSREEPIIIRIIEDITDRKRAEETVISSRDFYRTILNELPNPIRLADIDGGGDYFNRAWTAFTGRRSEQNLGEGWIASVHPEDRERVAAVLRDALGNRRVYKMEYRLQRADGTFRWVDEFGNPFNDLSGAFAGYVSACYDIHERKSFEDTLASISTTDDLTGLLNRRGFFTLAQQQIKLSNRSGRGLMLVFADLDGLKAINDTHGHRAGDQALAEIAEILRDVFRGSDIIARLGGDEFAVLMIEEEGVTEGRSVVERLQRAIEIRNALSQTPYDLAISAGIKHYDPLQPMSLDRLLSEADGLMYKEKKARRLRWRDAGPL